MFCNEDASALKRVRLDFRVKTLKRRSMPILAAVKQVAADPGFPHALDQLHGGTPAVKIPLMVGLRILFRFRRIISEIR